MLRVEGIRIGTFDSTSATYLSLQATAIRLASDLHRFCIHVSLLLVADGLRYRMICVETKSMRITSHI